MERGCIWFFILWVRVIMVEIVKEIFLEFFFVNKNLDVIFIFLGKW